MVSSRVSMARASAGTKDGRATGHARTVRAQMKHYGVVTAERMADVPGWARGNARRSGYARTSDVQRQRAQRPLGSGDSRQPGGKRQGLSPVEVAQLHAAQEGLCALCKRPLGDDFVVDHDHLLAARHGHNPEVGCRYCVRGLVCPGDNNWLAGFRDDPEFLRSAAEYAERRRKDRA